MPHISPRITGRYLQKVQQASVESSEKHGRNATVWGNKNKAFGKEASRVGFGVWWFCGYMEKHLMFKYGRGICDAVSHVRVHIIAHSVKYKQILKRKSVCVCQEVITGSWLDLPAGRWSKINIHIHTKMARCRLNPAFDMTISAFDLNSIENLFQLKKRGHERGHL